MTVAYASKVATTTYTTFLRLLFLWKGSVYRLIWFEMVVFMGMYAIISVSYRVLMVGKFKTYFEYFCVYCNKYNILIPVPFVLGFYVSLVVARWWEQFMALPWPDHLALLLTAFCHGNTERPTIIRRTVMRYTNLAYCLALRAVSSRARQRFPTEQHLVTAGIMTEEELTEYSNSKGIGYSLYFMPLVWSMDILNKARSEGLIRFDRAMELLTDEITDFRGRLGTIFAYDWVNLPLVYTQMATITVYSYFASCLFGWQYMDPSKGYKGYDIDLYVPIFGLLRFFFYIGWLKVAESLINPFGKDLDDFEIEYLIERNLNVSYLIVDEMHHRHPELVKDAFWGTTEIGLPDFSKTPDLLITDGDDVELEGRLVLATDVTPSTGDRFIGSLANTDFIDRKPSTIGFWRSGSIFK